MFFSTKRAIGAGVAAILAEFYAFNFVPRNINIIVTRTSVIKILDYIVNFLIFFVVAYLILTLIAYLIKLFSGKK